MRIGALILGCLCAAGIANAQSLFIVDLDGAQVPTASGFTGFGTITLNAAEDTMTVNITHNIPNAQVTDGHIHVGDVGVSGGIIFPFSGNGQNPINESIAITAPQVAILKANGYYVNIHTTSFPNGEIRGQINFAGTGLPTSTWVGLGVAAVLLTLVGGTYVYRRRLRARPAHA